MVPDFSKKTVETLAQRAAYLCSNPDCRVSTVGPNTEPDKSTTIGEAAHIYGARPDMARYDQGMSDGTRGEITNGVWLCRNCHKLIDRDPTIYPAELLFAWRSEHERFVLGKLGSPGDRTRFEAEFASLGAFDGYPPLIKRIVIDRPPGWEWRLTAELLRHLNRPLLGKLRDLRGGYYTLPSNRVGKDQAIAWVTGNLHEMQKLVEPLGRLLNRLTASWGPPGQPGDIAEIHHSCLLLRDALAQIVSHEEQLRFVVVDEDYEKLADLLRDCVGSQIEQFEGIPDALDEAVSLIESDHPGTIDKPHIIEKIITFDLPKGWEKQFSRELRRATNGQVGHSNGTGWLSVVWVAFLIFIVIYFVF